MRALRLEADVAQQRAREPADERVAGRKREGVADERPDDADHAEGHEAHHHRVERVLRPHQPAVEERQRGRHQKHQRRRDEHPGHIRLIHCHFLQKQLRPGVPFRGALHCDRPQRAVRRGKPHIRAAWP